jgi:NAD-dependent deacetylase
MESDNYRRAAELVHKSRRAVALTGAGISTPSGIADFRSPGSGVWNRVDPARVASIQSFMRDPTVFYDWFGSTAEAMYAAEPNSAHLALAELEKQGLLRAVVTQNIDGLHRKAGSQRVLEVHGNTRTASCTRCSKQVEAQPLLARYLQAGTIPLCPQCGGAIKPDVVLFGESLPLEVLIEAREEIAHCDLLLIIGSSLTVVPAADLPWLAIRSNAPVIICNRDPTWADAYATFVFRADVAQSVPALVIKA